MDNEKILADNKAVLLENEKNANRMMAIILNITVVIVGITWFLFESGFFYIRIHFRELMIFNIVLMALACGVSRYFKYEKPWIKYVLMAAFTVVYAVTTSALTYNVVLLIVVPIVLSVRYFDKKYTRFIGILTIIVFFIAYLYGANHGMLDLNFVQYAPGTTIVTNEKMWLDDAVKGIPYDGMLMLKNTMISNYFVKLLQYIIIAAVSIRLVDHCHNIMDKQRSLTETTARIGTELDLAKRIQADMLPSLFPAFPERDEFDLYASMDPAKEVGGDFYDFFMIDDDHLGMVIADVSGKGIPAAMFMMFSKNIIANNAMLGKSPAKALEDANNAICKNNSEDMFVTVWLGVLEISSGRLVAANAGHEYPAIKKAEGGFELLRDKHGLVVGAMEGVRFKEYELQLEPGSKIFVYTDGVPEATSTEKELFGTDRMIDALNTDPEASPKQILKNVRKSVDEFVKEAEQFDDLTMLCLEYRGTENNKEKQ